MTYQQTLEYLFNQLPMYQRIGRAAYKADLSNTIAICDLLKHPYKNFPSIHIAGTNGKGSVAHMLASILQESGYKTGLHTSPHLKDFRERVKINGQMISQDEVMGFVETYKTDFERIMPSFFEMTVGLAFWYFAKENVDIAILETGMGGRLDSTNVVTPELSVITNIGYDHMQFLGDTLGKIAVEKAGIIKAEVPVVIGETQAETTAIFKEAASQKNAPIYFSDQVIDKHDYTTDLAGSYQQKNLITALQGIHILKEKGWKIIDEAVKKGLKNVIRNTGFAGRWQVLSEKPLTICDSGHNCEGISYALQQIKTLSHRKLHIVLGMVNDKDVGKALELFPENADYYFCKADIPRGLDASILKETAFKNNLKGGDYASVKNALQAARENASEDDLIFIGGSIFVVAEVV